MCMDGGKRRRAIGGELKRLPQHTRAPSGSLTEISVSAAVFAAHRAITGPIGTNDLRLLRQRRGVDLVEDVLWLRQRGAKLLEEVICKALVTGRAGVIAA